MKRILLLILAFVIGIALVLTGYELQTGTGPPVNGWQQNGMSSNPDLPRFRHMGGSTFLSLGGEPRYADDCIGCGPMGDISIYHNTERNPTHTRYTLEANCGERANGRVVESSDIFNEGGQKIGKRCINVLGNAPRILWTKGDEYWIIGAPTVPLAVEFEGSETFRLWRSSEAGK